MIGRTISHYEIVGKLGEGGMGVVYKATDVSLDRTVALKFLAPHLVEDQEGRERFIREAKAAAALDHPNICTVYEINQEQDQTFIAMACIEGQSVKDKIAERPLKLEEALDIAIQTAQGLQAAHEKDIVHRDIKGANLMVTPQGQVKIMDFGLAQFAEQSRLTKTATMLGTPAYMSPEQAQRLPTDRRTDIWSLGVVIYEMVTGRLPFEGEREAAVAYSIVHEEPEPMTAQRVDVPVELDRIVGKAMAKSSDERYQHVDELLVDVKALKRGFATSHPADSKEDSRTKTPIAWIAVAAALTVLAVAVWRLGDSGGSTSGPDQFQLKQITRDSGLTYEPALSPDGSLVVYSSDRAGGGNLDLWVQQVSGGEPRRLTNDPADDHQPHFSPAGDRIVFRSERSGGGIYVMPVLGGTPVLLAVEGRRPRFSPDGSLVAYWTGVEWVAPSGMDVYVVSSTGGSARRVYQGRAPVWLPDGKHLLFAVRDRGEEWWVGSIEAEEAVPTGALEYFERHGLNRPQQWGGADLYIPELWLTESSSVVLTVRTGDSVNLWRVPLSLDNWRVSGEPKRLTFGANIEAQPGISPEGGIVFASLRANYDVWSLPIEPNDGQALGEVERITFDQADDIGPSVSADGKKLAFLSTRGDEPGVWVRDLASGETRALNPAPMGGGPPVISRSGKRVAYFARRVLYSNDLDTGVQRRLCAECGNSLRGWSPDESKLLFTKSGMIRALDRTNAETKILVGAGNSVFDARFSPDGHWIAFHMVTAPDRRQIFITRFENGEAAAQGEWIEITDGSRLDGRTEWSPDGSLLYFVSDRDGFRCIWAQRLDPATKRPTEDAFGVHHAHLANRQIMRRGNFSTVGLSLGGNRLFFSVDEMAGNIWKLEPSRPE